MRYLGSVTDDKDLVNKAKVTSMIQDNIDTTLTKSTYSADAKATGDALKNLDETKQDNLTFDNTPTQNSQNPVTSGGIKAAIDALTDRVDDIEDGLDEYAKVDGSYDAMTVGAAEQLLSNNYIENNTPYIFRKTADGASVGNRAYIDELVGGTITWNQLVQNGNFTSTSNWTAENGYLSVGDNVATFSVEPVEEEQSPNRGRLFQLVDWEKGRKYMMVAGLRAARTKTISVNAPETGYSVSLNTNWQTICILCATTDSQSNGTISFIDADDPTGANVYIRNVMLIDLTLMFGSAIADYIYSLGNTAALAWFRKLFPNNYYAYDAGSLKSYNPTNRDLAYKTTGLNQWDEQWELGTIDPTTGQNASTTSTVIRAKNINPCLPNETYYLGENVSTVFWYDSDGRFISSQYNGSAGYVRTSPANAAGFRFTTKSGYGATYKNDLCINLSSDRNGEYEPYQEFSYNFPAATMRLRGIPKLDANNRLYYDGDTYSQSGTITRRFEQESLSAQRWTMVSAGIFWAPINGRAFAADKFNLRSDKYATQEASNSTIGNIQSLFNTYGNGLYVNGGSDTIYICDSSCSTLNEFKLKITGSGVFIYEKATASTTSATKFPSTIVVDRYGTERFVDSRTVRVPVGHVTRYTQDLAGKLEAQPDVAASDGDYIIRQTNGKMALVPKTNVYPTPPTTSGRYQLIATVSNGSVTYSWEAV